MIVGLYCYITALTLIDYKTAPTLTECKPMLKYIFSLVLLIFSILFRVSCSYYPFFFFFTIYFHVNQVDFKMCFIKKKKIFDLI